MSNISQVEGDESGFDDESSLCEEDNTSQDSQTWEDDTSQDSQTCEDDTSQDSQAESESESEFDDNDDDDDEAAYHFEPERGKLCLSHFCAIC